MGSDSKVEKSQKDKKKMQALSLITKPLAVKKLYNKTFKFFRKGACYCRGH